MMKKEDVFETLTALSGIYGAGSFGYLPQLFGAKWLLDNKASKEYQDFVKKYPRLAECESLDAARMIFSKRVLDVLSPDISSIGTPYFRVDESVSYQDTEKIISYTSKALSSLNLSEENVSRKAVLEGFDMYLASCLAEARIDISVYPGAAERIVAGISALYGEVSSAYDPFCKLGSLISAVSAKRKTASDVCRIYADITRIRALLAGDDLFVSSLESIEYPLVSEHGMEVFDLVVSDLSDVGSDEVSTMYQMDIHRRFQELCPGADKLTPSVGFCHAFASMAYNGHCIVMTNGSSDYRFNDLFAGMSFSGAASLVLEDYLEAVIDVVLPVKSKVRSRRNRTFSDSRKIYVFSRCKDAERRGKVLFVNAAGLPADDEVVEKVVSCVKEFSEIPGFSKVADSKDVIGRREVMVDAVQFTAVLEAPKSEDLCRIVRDLKRLEGERISLMKDIEAVSFELSKRG